MPSTYYDFGPILSHNAVYNFVVGARGVGKTYGAKRKALRDYFAKGDQFIYLRRYNTELKGIKTTFMSDIAHEFPEWDFRVYGEEIKTRHIEADKKDPWNTIGYFAALSKGQQKKSVSYHKVKTIIFDEFIIERGVIHYMANEAKAFNDFYSTVDRYKDKTKVFFLANSISIMNPYFIEWDIAPKMKTEWITSHKGFIVAHFPQSDAFIGEVYATKFGQFIQHSEYADYAVGSEFSDNNSTLIKSKSANARYNCTIETKTGTFSLWIDQKAQGAPIFYVTSKHPKQQFLWTLLPERMNESRVLIDFSDKTLQYLRTGYSRAKVFFDKPQTRNSFIGIYRR